jgi:protein-disulfide isomerase
MKAQVSLAAMAFALALAGCGESGGDLNQVAAANMNTPLPQIAAPNNGDWTQVVQETPDGGYRMGNPDAPVKLVEYASISCPHCAEFSEAAHEPLTNRYVRSGQVSWEFRPVLLFGTDPGIFLLMRCQGAQPFFALAEQLYATQREWSQRASQIPPSVQNLPPQQQVGAVARGLGMDQFFRQRGMPQARVDSCLSDQQGLDALVRTQQAVQRDGVTGTPTFFINGQQLEGVGYWNNGNAAQSVEPRLRAAIGS